MTMSYHYVECGLDNVMIENMAPCIDDVGEEVYFIPNILGLHKVIAHGIITHAVGMSPKELRFLRTEMGMTQAELAKVVKKDHQTIGRWERGETPLDQNAEAVIRAIAAQRLGIDPDLSMEEIAERCVPSAEMTRILIDGSDPSDYKLKAA